MINRYTNFFCLISKYHGYNIQYTIQYTYLILIRLNVIFNKISYAKLSTERKSMKGVERNSLKVFFLI